MNDRHHYSAKIIWTGNLGDGTKDYKAYERSHVIRISGKPDLPGSADPQYRGDKTKHNPEDMLVSALAACHMLYYLHLCAVSGVVVTKYEDDSVGVMEGTNAGGGAFTGVTLHPMVWVTEEEMVVKAEALHKKANELCFIANSVNFPVRHQPEIKVHKS